MKFRGRIEIRNLNILWASQDELAGEQKIKAVVFGLGLKSKIQLT